MDRDKTNTPQETLDLVDENDLVIGRISKAQANSNPHSIHREVRIVLFDVFGRMLLQKRSSKKKVYPSVWAESCQGHVPCGLTYEEAAHKELLEELGFDTQLACIGRLIIRLPNETHFAAWFIGQYQGEEINPEPEEVADFKFVSKDELFALQTEMIPSSWQILQEL